jgi:hypothetical protein
MNHYSVLGYLGPTCLASIQVLIFITTYAIECGFLSKRTAQLYVWVLLGILDDRRLLRLPAIQFLTDTFGAFTVWPNAAWSALGAGLVN